MVIGVLKEQAKNETRVALVPKDVALLKKAGYEILMEKNAGLKAGYEDTSYQEKGANIHNDAKGVIEKSTIIVKVRAAASEKQDKVLIDALKKDQVLIGLLEPYGPHRSFDQLKDKKVQSFALELMPRTTRAQSMDVLSSMANLAGYKAVILGASESAKMFPMMMTAAGTITPANVFILGVGVAGLQAIATAKRLGALVSAYDVRPEVKEQVASLGAKFIELELDSAEGEGGYAKEMDEAFYQKQREMMLEELSSKDVVITTANIPGKKAPTLITKAMVENMKVGSVIVDLAAERGGNCELTEAGKTIEHKGVKIMGPLNIPSTLAYNASALYSKNITNFINNLFIKGEKTINFEDDIVQKTAIIKDGSFTHEAIKPKEGGSSS